MCKFKAEITHRIGIAVLAVDEAFNCSLIRQAPRFDLSPTFRGGLGRLPLHFRYLLHVLYVLVWRLKFNRKT